MFTALARRSAHGGGLELAGKAIFFGPSGAAFRKPVTISLPVDQGVINGTGTEDECRRITIIRQMTI